MKTWLLVLVLALLYSFLSYLREVPISHPDDDTTADDAANKSVYNLVPLQAPAVTGWPLQAFAWVMSRSLLGPYLIRYLFHKNGLPLMRQLAARVPHPTYFPAHHYQLIKEEQQKQQELQEPVRQDVLAEYNVSLLQDFDFWNEQFHHFDDNRHTPPYYSTLDYHQLYRTQQATPSQVVQQTLHAIHKLNPTLKFMAEVMPDHLLQPQAQASDERYRNGQPLSILDGVPVLIKDAFLVRGVPLHDGTRDIVVDNNENDYVTAALRAAGAIIVGTTVSTEGGVTPLGYNAWWDGPHNPYALDYYCGGSSSGSAVAVAAGLVPLTVGMDGGGSIRVPAGMSGILGLAPTFGRVPTRRRRYTVSKTGPMAATLVDLAVGHLIMGQVQLESWHHGTLLLGQVPQPRVVVEQTNNRDGDDGDDKTEESNQQQQQQSKRLPLKGYRLGVYWDHFVDSDPEVVQTSWKAVEVLKAHGAQVVNVTIPHLRELHLAHATKILAEFAIAFDAAFYDTQNITFEANTQITIAMGKALTANEVLASEYVRTHGLQVVCHDIFRQQGVDAIVSPMLGLKVPKPTPGYRGYGESNSALVMETMRFVPLANLLGLPGLSIPVGYEADTGLPIGFQLLGDAWSEHKLIHLAKYVEAAIPRKRPPHFVDVLAPFLSEEAES